MRMVGGGVGDPRCDAGPDRLERDAVAQQERRREEHLAVAHAGRGGDRQCLVRDAVDVVGVPEAATHQVEDAEEVGEVVVAVQLSRIVDAEVDAVLAGQLGDGVRRRSALDVHVQLDLRHGADVIVGCGVGEGHHPSCPGCKIAKAYRWISSPASTGSVAPVTYRASSEARYNTALDTSRDSTHGTGSA